MSISEMSTPVTPTSPPLEWPAGGRVDDVAELLRERIADGRAPSASGLSERQLAHELGVSRDVLTDALGLLRREGVIALASPCPGMSVLPGDDWSILLSAYALREAIDGVAARLAAERVGPAMEPVLHAAIERQRQALAAGDRTHYARADSRFHCALVDASGNHFLPFHAGLVRSTSRSAATLLGTERLARAVDERLEILAAVSRRDGTAAERAAREHIRTTASALEAAG
jgi:DNA-binding GntR family transcriptional regulator